jgi:hypothetical protein
MRQRLVSSLQTLVASAEARNLADDEAIYSMLESIREE